MVAAMIAALLALLLSSPADAESLRRTAPAYLTAEQSGEHYAAARLAGLTYGVDPEVLLAVAWHESRYQVGAVTREPGGRVSCGVMTPEPLPRCPEPSLLRGYLAGAAHLRSWLRLYGGDYGRALWAYAGGGATVRACLAGSESRPCLFAGQTLALARSIRTRPST